MIFQLWQNHINLGKLLLLFSHSFHPTSLLAVAGQSQKKINFLSNLLKENAFDWVVPQALTGHTWELAVGSSPDKKRWLVYCGRNQPKYEILSFLPKGKKYSAKLIDAWNETIKQCDYTVTYTKLVGLPQKPFQAILLIEK